MMRKKRYMLFVAVAATVLSGCTKGLPTDREAFSLDMNFTVTDYSPIVGRDNFYANNFNNGESSLPLSFRISDVRTFDGRPAPELLKLFPVEIWKTRYTGLETSAEEIRAKREVVMRPLWDIGQHSGTLTMYSEANSTILRTLPDSCYVFDVEVSSSGGRRYFRDLKLTPLPEEDFEVGPISLFNFIGEDRGPLGMLRFWFNRKGDGSALTFKVLNPDLSLIDLTNFNTTNWDMLVHGFNRRFAAGNTEVTYDVEYPIPLMSEVPTPYVEDGFAVAEFSFDRLGSGGAMQRSRMRIPFKIHQPGDWEVIVYFVDQKPLFRND